LLIPLQLQGGGELDDRTPRADLDSRQTTPNQKTNYTVIFDDTKQGSKRLILLICLCVAPAARLPREN